MMVSPTLLAYGERRAIKLLADTHWQTTDCSLHVLSFYHCRC